MNLKKAKEVLSLHSREKDIRRTHREIQERVEYLDKWISNYTAEKIQLTGPLSDAFMALQQLPSTQEVREAKETWEKYVAVQKELHKLKKKVEV